MLCVYELFDVYQYCKYCTISSTMCVLLAYSSHYFLLSHSCPLWEIYQPFLKRAHITTFDAVDISPIHLLQSSVLKMQSKFLKIYIILKFSSVIYLDTVWGCEQFDRFKMPSLFKQGDIMIGGIFPVYIKEIFSSCTYEKEPPEVKCEG